MSRIILGMRHALSTAMMLVTLAGCGRLQSASEPTSRLAPLPLANHVETYTPGPTATAGPPATATPTSPPSPAPDISLPAKDLFLDPAWYRETLIDVTDHWNGGLDGQSGMGAYQVGFDGCFYVDLTYDWQQKVRSFGSRVPQSIEGDREIPEYYRNLGYASTVIAQSRAIYINEEAYRAAGSVEGERFLKAVNQGVTCLITHFWDPEHGGFFWEVQHDGRVRETQKQGYGNVHALMALAQAYSVTGNPEHLRTALHQLRVVEEQFLDPEYPGGIRPGFNRDFSVIIGVNNVDVFTHYFEALLALYDVTEGAERDHIANLIETAADFLINQLARRQAGHPDRLYVAYNYDRYWNPAKLAYTRASQWSGAMHSTPGHCVELAYLLSRAVERGFDPDWLDTAYGLMNFAAASAFEGETGGMLYETLDYDGRPLVDNPDNDKFIWWAQAESARAFLHLTVVREKDYTEAFKTIEKLIHGPLTDPIYGGWYDWVETNTLQPGGFDKGNVWKVNYHYTMFFVEALRLAEKYPDQVEAIDQQYQAMGTD
ncbi:MAG: AGE family epimerase/isomerase [Anaerolineae bacterium]|nr:AGE family epimerase/isomerase [Anaerolineae bacterium]